MNIFTEKLKDTLIAVMPVVILVILLNFTLVPLGSNLLAMFIVGAALVVLGLTFFLIGVDLGITPLGSVLGHSITKKNKLWIVVASGLILGFFISFAEPGLLILAHEIDAITNSQISSMTIMVVVSLGIALMMVLGFIRILFDVPLYIILNIAYLFVFVLSIFTPPEFLAIAFDTSGATTGVLAVPFILSLSLGITSMKKDSKASEKDSFGLVSITSVGAIISVMVLSLASRQDDFSGSATPTAPPVLSPFRSFLNLIPESIKESAIAFLPLAVIFLTLAIFTSVIHKRDFKRMSFGFIYSFLGLSMFFLGVNAGFMSVGGLIGRSLTKFDTSFFLVATGFVLGVVTILAEPAVYVLTHQIEEVTAGYVKRPSVLTALSIGVGFAVALSMIRIVMPSVQLWHYILPGYIISLALTFIVPKLFVGIAFDAGGVATGPMTATFILAFTNGAADAYPGADLLIDGFGMIAMVALMPIITLQILGLIFKIKTRKKGVDNVE